MEKRLVIERNGFRRNVDAGERFANPQFRVPLTAGLHAFVDLQKVWIEAVDHKQGMAPYFREYLRKEVTDLLLQKNEDGSWKNTVNLGQDINTAGNELFPTFCWILARGQDVGTSKSVRHPGVVGNVSRFCRVSEDTGLWQTTWCYQAQRNFLTVQHCG